MINLLSVIREQLYVIQYSKQSQTQTILFWCQSNLGCKCARLFNQTSSKFDLYFWRQRMTWDISLDMGYIHFHYTDFSILLLINILYWLYLESMRLSQYTAVSDPDLWWCWRRWGVGWWASASAWGAHQGSRSRTFPTGTEHRGHGQPLPAQCLTITRAGDMTK